MLQCFFEQISLLNNTFEKKFHQIDLRIVKFPKLTKNNILSNFDLHVWPSKSDIF